MTRLQPLQMTQTKGFGQETQRSVRVEIDILSEAHSAFTFLQDHANSMSLSLPALLWKGKLDRMMEWKGSSNVTLHGQATEKNRKQTNLENRRKRIQHFIQVEDILKHKRSVIGQFHGRCAEVF